MSEPHVRERHLHAFPFGCVIGGLLELLHLDLPEFLWRDRRCRDRCIDRYGCRCSVSPKLDGVPRIQFCCFDPVSVDESAIRALIVPYVETVRTGLDESVLFRGDPFSSWVEPHRAIFATPDGYKPRFEFENLSLERAAGDGEPQFHTTIIGTKGLKSNQMTSGL